MLWHEKNSLNLYERFVGRNSSNYEEKQREIRERKVCRIKHAKQRKLWIDLEVFLKNQEAKKHFSVFCRQADWALLTGFMMKKKRFSSEVENWE